MSAILCHDLLLKCIIQLSYFSYGINDKCNIFALVTINKIGFIINVYCNSCNNEFVKDIVLQFLFECEFDIGWVYSETIFNLTIQRFPLGISGKDFS